MGNILNQTGSQNLCLEEPYNVVKHHTFHLFFTISLVGQRKKSLTVSEAAVLTKIHGYHPVMSIFDAYDQEFNSLCQEISKNISELKGCSSNDADKIAVSMRQIEGLISQAGDLTKQMEVEVRSHDPATRKVLLDKVNQYKKSLTTHKIDYDR